MSLPRALPPFQVLLDRSRGVTLPLPEPLRTVYGTLRLGKTGPEPTVFANFASTLDGVVGFPGAGAAPGRAITGPDLHDRFLMGLLRASADSIVVGAGTVRASPRHIWTAEHAFALGASSFEELRRRLRVRPAPPTFVVTASGSIDPGWSLFSSSDTEVVVVATARAARRISGLPGGRRLTVHVAGKSSRLTSGAILDAVHSVGPARRILLEGGPHLMADFLAGNAVDELFLTLAPQVAGRGPEDYRPGLAEGRRFLPGRPRWGSLEGIRQGGTLTFLRTRFEPRPPE